MNTAVLQYFEWLVIKRIARRIYVNRLPVGHIHNDADCCFGRINRLVKSEHLITLEH